MIAYLGIDPGVKGACAVIYEPSGVAEVYDYGSAEDLLLLQALAEAMWCQALYVLIERVHSTPQMGVASSFKFGANFGEWCGRLEALGIPYDYVAPGAWQRVMFKAMTKSWKTVNKKMTNMSTGKKVTRSKRVMDTKTMSLYRARTLFPSVLERLKRNLDHNRSDALLITEYLRRTKGGGL